MALNSASCGSVMLATYLLNVSFFFFCPFGQVKGTMPSAIIDALIKEDPPPPGRYRAIQVWSVYGKGRRVDGALCVSGTAYTTTDNRL